jgi:PKD repeat protein
MKRFSPLSALAIAIALLLLSVPVTASSATPLNDNFSNATAVTPLPFSATIDLTDATTEAVEPFGCGGIVGDVWYRVTPASTQSYQVTLSHPDPYICGVVYRDTGSGAGGLSLIGSLGGGTPYTFTFTSGQTYYVQVSKSSYAETLTAELDIDVMVPPANDDFADAMGIASLPFANDVDTSAATVELGEPTLGTPPPSERTVWYSYTPSSSGSVTAHVAVGGPAGLAAYVGTSLSDLTPLDFQYAAPITIHVDAGKTYYFQTGLWGQAGAQIRFTLEAPPAPVASFYFYPIEPTVFDTVQFTSQSYDPGQGYNPVYTLTWDFGDHSTATGGWPQHQFARDGNYTTKLTITTPDGRSASTSQVVHVRTHDVAVNHVIVLPMIVKAGHTGLITVWVSNSRYTENVLVHLSKSGGGGWQQIGELTKSVRAMQFLPTLFTFTYKFTNDDAAIGNVTFQATATIQGGPLDAIPSNNTGISSPTPVKRS